MTEAGRIPLILLTGFLGTGKTSLLTRWIREPEFSGALVIVNELGEVGLDQQTLARDGESARLLENGCACCESSGDLVSTLESAIFDRLNGNGPPFGWIIFETTGLADPKAILDLLPESDILRGHVHLAGVVSTFDAVRGPAQMLRHPEVARQLDCATVIVTTRTDVATEGARAKAHDLLHGLRPDVPRLDSGRDGLPASALRAALGTQPQSWHRPVAAPAMSAVHTQAVSTAFLPLDEPLSRMALATALQRLLDDQQGTILRLKGLVRLIGEETPHVVQAAEDIEIAPCPEGLRMDDIAMGLTIISQGAPASALAASLSARLTFRGLSRPA